MDIIPCLRVNIFVVQRGLDITSRWLVTYGGKLLFQQASNGYVYFQGLSRKHAFVEKMRYLKTGPCCLQYHHTSDVYIQMFTQIFFKCSQDIYIFHLCFAAFLFANNFICFIQKLTTQCFPFAIVNYTYFFFFV